MVDIAADDARVELRKDPDAMLLAPNTEASSPSGTVCNDGQESSNSILPLRKQNTHIFE